MEKKILLIDRAAFIDWFFDEDMIESFVGIYDVTSELSKTGTFTITAQHLLDTVGYLPEIVASQEQPNQDQVILDAYEEIDMEVYDEIKFA